MSNIISPKYKTSQILIYPVTLSIHDIVTGLTNNKFIYEETADVDTRLFNYLLCGSGLHTNIGCPLIVKFTDEFGDPIHLVADNLNIYDILRQKDLPYKLKVYKGNGLLTIIDYYIVQGIDLPFEFTNNNLISNAEQLGLDVDGDYIRNIPSSYYLLETILNTTVITFVENSYNVDSDEIISDYVDMLNYLQ